MGRRVLAHVNALMTAVGFCFAVSAKAGAGESAVTFQTVQLPEEKAPVSANRSYQLLMPKGYDAAATAAKDDVSRLFPLVVYMHGGGSKGSDGVKPVREELPRLLATEELRERFPCFVLVPQCRDGDDVAGTRPNNWVKWDHQRETPDHWRLTDDEPSDQLRGAMAALEDVLARFPVDRARVYLSGVSMGGSATWNWASHDPARFAALLPVCGLSDARRAAAIAKLPVWTFHGDADASVPVQRTRDMVAALREKGSEVRYTEIAGGGHGIAKRVFVEDDFAALQWLFGQRRVESVSIK